MSAKGPIIHPQGKNRFLPGQALYIFGILLQLFIQYKKLQILNYKLIYNTKNIVSTKIPHKIMKILNNQNYTRKLNKILFIITLIAILYCVLFYLDMINQLSLQNIVSMILGFLIMIIAQLRFISYYYKERMQNYDLDEVGIVLDIIKNNVFGEINLNYIKTKQKKKYYFHTKDQNDRLFSDQNQKIFDSVMTVMRSKSQNFNDNRLNVLREKWNAFFLKNVLFSNLLTNILKVTKQRVQSYKQFQDKIMLLIDQDYEKWDSLFLTSQQLPQQNIQQFKQLQNLSSRNYLQLKRLILQKNSNMQSMLRQIQISLVKQFDIYADQMKKGFSSIESQVIECLNQNASNKHQYIEINQKIRGNNLSIDKQTKKIKTKPKVSQNMEFIFNSQYNLRFLRVQLSNLQIKMAQIKDNLKKSSQKQYQVWLQYQRKLEESGIKKINNKISNYLKQYLGKVKLSLDKIKQKTQKFEQFNTQTKDINLNNSINEQQKRLYQFKTFILNLKLLAQNQVSHFKKFNNIMKDYEKQWKIKNNQYKLIPQDQSIGDRIIDNLFVEYIQSVNKKQIDMLSKLINILQQQAKQIQQMQYRSPNLKHTGSLNQQLLIRNKKSSKQDMIQFSPRRITLLDNFQKNRMRSWLPQILMCFAEGYNALNKQIQQRKEHIDYQNINLYTDNPKLMRMNEYKNQLFKIERQQFLKEEQAVNKKNEKLLDQSSLAFVNRILDVFFLQWRNSDFFHQLLKQEIEISLNTKRPPILSYMNVKYIKLHEKNPGIIKNLNVLSENIFICQFEAEVDFKGIVAVHIQTKANNKVIDIRLVIKQFYCPIRICFTPFSLGKSNVTMMKTPKLSIQYSAKIDGWQLTKIPFLSLFIQLFIVVKLRKKFLYPKKATIKVPLAVKNAISQAIKQRVNYQKLLQKKKKSD